jgi:HPt (histidine-containing phosphotransfer) domain-containing protein
MPITPKTGSLFHADSHDKPIDETVLDALRRLQSDARPNFPTMIVGLFLDTAPSVLKELGTAALVGDLSGLRTSNHRFLSASTAVGAVRLSGLCNELDAALQAGAVPDAGERVHAIAEEYERVEAALRVWCATHSEPGVPQTSAP